MCMGFKSTFSIFPKTTIRGNNHATLGGAIYVADASPLSYCTLLAPYLPCFFQFPGQNLSNSIDVQLVFQNNSAGIAGSMLYGGAVDNCKPTNGLDSYSSSEVFDMLVHFADDNNTTLTISSDPLQICPCENNLPNSSTLQYDFAHRVSWTNISSFCGCSWTKKWNSF